MGGQESRDVKQRASSYSFRFIKFITLLDRCIILEVNHSPRPLRHPPRPCPPTVHQHLPRRIARALPHSEEHLLPFFLLRGTCSGVGFTEREVPRS